MNKGKTQLIFRRNLFPRIMGLGGLALFLPRPSYAASKTSSRLEYRLELWRSYARNQDSLIARYQVTRESALLERPLKNFGTLAFQSPNQLVLKDDHESGVTSSLGVDPGSLRNSPLLFIVAQSGPTQWSFDPREDETLRWLHRLFIQLFAARTPEQLLNNCRVQALKGRTPRLEISPPRDTEIRKVIRSLTITLDPVGGAIRSIDLREAQGDRVILQLSEHQQNPPAHQLSAIFGDGSDTELSEQK